MQNQEMISPDVVQEMKETMDAAYSRRDYDSALETSYRILHHIPNDDDALYTIGYCHYMLSNYEEGLEACQTLLSYYPRYASAFQLAGKIYLQLRQWDKALHFLEQALELTPSDATIHHNIAEAHFYAKNSLKKGIGPFKFNYKKIFFNKMALAEKAILKAIELQPGDADYHLLYSLILVSQIKDDDAEIQLREALLLEPMDPSVHRGYARLYYVQGKIKECRDHIDQALMLDAANEEALEMRSKLNQYEIDPKPIFKEIIAIQEERMRFSSNRTPFYMSIAKLKLEGRIDDPIKELRAYIRQVPDDLNAKLLYGQALFNDWRYFHARGYFKKLTRRYPDNPYAEQWYKKCRNVGFWDKFMLCPLGFFVIRPLMRVIQYGIMPVVYGLYVIYFLITQLFKRNKGGQAA